MEFLNMNPSRRRYWAIVAFVLATVMLRLIFQHDALLDIILDDSPRLLQSRSRPYLAVFVTHKRTDCLERSMRSFLEQQHADKFDILISLDYPDAAQDVLRLIATLEHQYARIDNEIGEDQDRPFNIQLILKPYQPTRWLALQWSADQKVDQHVFFALKTAAASLSHQYIVMIEEDLVLAPDFLDLMISSIPAWESDHTLFCVSGWNDYGYSESATDEKRLLRTDVFPSLGFMLSREQLADIVSRWPGYDFWGWDIWMRRLVSTGQRECIAPEIPRVFHDGKDGVHHKGNDAYARKPVSKLPGGLGTFSEALKTIHIDLYDRQIKEDLAHAIITTADTALDRKFKLEKNSTYIVLIEQSDCIRLTKRFYLFYSEMCRMMHRGLFDIRLTRDKAFAKKGSPSHTPADNLNSRVYFVDRRIGAEWIPKEYWKSPPSLSPIAAKPAQSCKEACLDNGLTCSSIDAAHVNTCTTLQTASHRGAEIRPDGTCVASSRSGFFCEDSVPDVSILCPCIPKPSALTTLKFNPNYA